MGRLQGKVALITGGARGQGADEARLFIAEGATVYITDVLEEQGEKTATALGARFMAQDVTSAARWTEIVSAIVAEHGRIDVLVNNAGVFKVARLLDTSEEDYDRIIAINQKGVFLGMQAVAPTMCDAGSGAIVNISSLAGLEGAPGAFAYGASKWAVRGMSRTAAQELGRFGVRVNSVHPGFIDTEMMSQTPAVVSGKMEKVMRLIPLGRTAEAEEVAKLVLFLSCDESSYCTGSEFTVDGGLHR
jgi:3alpha(or 20beta)-hydroxysteroid dehydrogenase